MRKLLAAAGMLMILPLTLIAQENYTPKAELFTGVSYLRLEKTNQVGWNASLDGNVNKNLGLVADISGYYNSQSQTLTGISAKTNGSIYSLLAGPRVSDPRGRWNPFAQALLGWARMNSKLTSGGFSSSAANNAFSAVFGGGLDFNLSNSLSVRLVDVDYVLLRSNGQKPQGVRVSSGLVFNLGKKRQY